MGSLQETVRSHDETADGLICARCPVFYRRTGCGMKSGAKRVLKDRKIRASAISASNIVSPMQDGLWIPITNEAGQSK